MLPITYGDFGRQSQTTHRNAKLNPLWRQAARQNEDALARGEEGRGEWVPAAAIVVRHDILPRGVDMTAGAIDAYAAAFDQLPPITVQRDSFVLLGGLHRLHASVAAGSDLIRIREVDVPDSELWWAAWEDNERNGVAYRTSERVAALRRALQDPRFEHWTTRDLAAKFGLNKDTVTRHLMERRPKTGHDATITTRETRTERDVPTRETRVTLTRTRVDDDTPDPNMPWTDEEWGWTPPDEDEPARVVCTQCGEILEAGVDDCVGCAVHPVSAEQPFEPTPIRTEPPAAVALSYADAERIVEAIENLAAIEIDGETVWRMLPTSLRSRVLAESVTERVIDNAETFVHDLGAAAFRWRHAS